MNTTITIAIIVAVAAIVIVFLLRGRLSGVKIRVPGGGRIDATTHKPLTPPARGAHQDGVRAQRDAIARDASGQAATQRDVVAGQDAITEVSAPPGPPPKKAPPPR
ncbi:MAG: hypothetical protein U0470_00045, partial [Anaerolineae bacterium]